MVPLNTLKVKTASCNKPGLLVTSKVKTNQFSGVILTRVLFVLTIVNTGWVLLPHQLLFKSMIPAFGVFKLDHETTLESGI